MFSIIAAVGKNREIGRGGELVFHLKDDMRFFRETTQGHTVLMGRKTWESLPGKLPRRENLVVSAGEVAGADGVVTDLEGYVAAHSESPEEILVMGGEQLYRRMLPEAKVLYLTEIEATAANADRFFPEFDESGYDKIVIKRGSENGVAYTIAKYVKK